MFEPLEERAVPANIVWTNRLTKSDTFSAAERRVIDWGIRVWEKKIVDFNFGWPASTVHNEVRIKFRGGANSGIDLGSNILGVALVSSRGGGAITIDARGGSGGWYVDPNPKDRVEYPKTVTSYHFSGGPSKADLLSVVLHEIGHILGLGHSSNNLGLMSATQQSGTRQLPALEDLKGITRFSSMTVNHPQVPRKVFFVPAFDPSADESVTNPVIRVALNNLHKRKVTVNYAVTGGTATAGSDFQLANGTLTFARGEHRKNIPLQIIDDAETFEGFETIQITLSAPVGAKIRPGWKVFTYTIFDGDF
jgi:hypothetical protein